MEKQNIRQRAVICFIDTSFSSGFRVSDLIPQRQIAASDRLRPIILPELDAYEGVSNAFICIILVR